MSIENRGNNIKLIDCISEDSNNSIEGNFITTAKLITLNNNGLSEEKNSRKKFMKKNTRMSSNNEEDIEYFDNENENNINLQVQTTEDNKEFNNSDNNLIIAQNKNKLFYSSIPNINLNSNEDNKKEKRNNSENSIKKYNSGNIYDSDIKNNLTKSNFSPGKKRKKLVLEEKSKNRGKRGSIYALEFKEEKEEIKNYRKDKNGTEICKKNKRKVRIGFSEPFVRVTLIESFKKYNVMSGIPKEDNYFGGRAKCECCLIY